MIYLLLYFKKLISFDFIFIKAILKYLKIELMLEKINNDLLTRNSVCILEMSLSETAVELAILAPDTCKRKAQTMIWINTCI